MDTTNQINLGLLIVTAITAGVAIWAAVTAGKSRKDAARASDAAGEHERAANVARAESSAALTRVADLIEQQTEAMPDWVPESQGGGHLRWDVINRTGGIVTARLEFPDQGPEHELAATDGGLFDDFLDPGEGLGFTWKRFGPAPGRVVRVNVIWTKGEAMERVTPLRVKWPDA